MPADISKLAKMTATVLETAADFILNLRVFANLLYALFTSTCPLFKQLKDLIKALATYNPKALKQMTKKTRGSILWIITLQTRRFFRGEISIMSEFQLMKNKLTARDPLIYHAEVPDILTLCIVHQHMPALQAAQGSDQSTGNIQSKGA